MRRPQTRELYMSTSRTWTRTASRILTHPATARAAMKAVGSIAQRVANPPTNEWLDAGLNSIGLQRQPSTAEQIGQAMQWIAAGAALGAGAGMASPNMRPMVNDAMNVASHWASTAASRSQSAARDLRDMAVDRGDDALEIVGLQRIPSTGRRIATTGAWIGLGVAVGTAIGMAMSEFSREMAAESSRDTTQDNTQDDTQDDAQDAAQSGDEHDTEYAHVH